MSMKTITVGMIIISALVISSIAVTPSTALLASSKGLKQVLLANMTDRELMNVQTRNMMNIMYHGTTLAEMEDIQKRNVMISKTIQ